MVELHYTNEALNDLKKLERNTARRIVRKIEWNVTQHDPLHQAKALQGRLRGLYRYRIGHYRVIFEYTAGQQVHICMVLAIQHRKDIYR